MKKYNKNQEGSQRNIGCLIVIFGTIIVWSSIFWLIGKIWS